MKNVWICMILLFVGVHVCCADGYRIKGKIIGGGEGMKIFLTTKSSFDRVVFDSAIIKNGEFEFQGRMDFPALRAITINKDVTNRNTYQSTVSLPFFLDNSSIEIVAPYDSLPSLSSNRVSCSIKIIGSPSNDLYMAYCEGMRMLNVEYDKVWEACVRAYYYDLEKDDAGKFILQPTFDLLSRLECCKEQIYRYQINFIKRYPDSPVSLQVLKTLPLVKYGRKEMHNVFSLLSENLKNSSYGKLLFKELTEKPIYTRDKYVDIELLNQEGDTVKLSDMIQPEKYTLLEIWASWCGPCRMDIPYLKESYKTWYDKGFNIVSVSIDSNKEQWKKALKQEQMPWIQLCDKGHNFDCEIVKEYGVKGVPSSFLIDPQGEIILINGRGGLLDMKLVELLDK